MRLEENILTERLPLVFGGRGLRRYPANVKPGRLGFPTMPPVSGYIAWWDPSDVSSLTLGSGKWIVSQFNDKSGSGFHATASFQASIGIHPTLLGGLNCLNFIPATRYATNCPSSDRTETTFMVGMVGTLADYSTILGSGATGGRQIRLDQTNGKVTCNAQFSAGVFTTSTLAASVGVPFVLCVKLDTSTWECRMSGQTTETGSNSTTFAAGSKTNIGENSSSGGERFNGFLGEMLVYDTALSSGDIDAVMGYLRTKWGV